MKTKFIRKRVALAVIIAALAFAIVPIFSPTEAPVRSVAPAQSETGYLSAIIRVGDSATAIAWQDGATLYEALDRARREGRIDFGAREYSGLGYFIESIGSLSEGNGKFLTYFINGKRASVGVSSYLLKHGDVIEWKLQ